MLRAVRDFPGMGFESVLDEEMEEIATRRRPNEPSTAREECKPFARAEEAKLAGLAFSGGGIRSATFNLGVLQCLGESGLLRSFDYLSTVSGGGYIGSWVHAWIHRADKNGGGGRGIDEVEKCLAQSATGDPEDAKAGPIRFLRRYSNYLTPKTGFLSADT